MKGRERKVMATATLGLLLAISLMVGSSESAEKPVWVRIDGGPQGSAKNIKMSIIGETIRRANPKWRVQVISANLLDPTLWAMLKNGQLDCFYTIPRSLTTVAKGMLYGEKVEPVKSAWVGPYAMHDTNLFFLEKVRFNSLAEVIKEKYPIKLAFPPPSSSPERLCRMVIEAYGSSVEEMKGWGAKFFNGGSGRGADLMRDGLAEGMLFPTSTPNSPIAQLALNHKLKAVGIGEPDVVAKLEATEIFTKAFIPKGSYTFAPDPIPCVRSYNLLVVRRNMPDQIAYDMAKSLWENKDSMVAAYPGFKMDYTPENVARLVELYGDRIHPGALKYYKEQGIVQ